MTTSISLCGGMLLLSSLLLLSTSFPQPSVALDPGVACLADCLQYGVSLLCSCERSLEQELLSSPLKRGGAFPFRYGKRGLKPSQQMPFRYGKRLAEKRQFRYGKRSADASAEEELVLGYGPRRVSAYDQLSSIDEEQ